MRNVAKGLLSFFILQNSFAPASAQIGNYKITYRHCIQFDSAQLLTDTLGMEAVLIGNDKTSSYVFAKLPKELWGDSLNSPPGTVIDQADYGNVTTVRMVASGKRYDAFGNMVFFDKKQDSVFTREKMPNNYVITKEVTPAISWVIEKEFKIIQGYKCQKATAQFRGRNYKAWYTTELPIVDGPWKFKNLPGLILQIEDAAGQVKLYAASIEKQSAEPVVQFVDRGSYISMKEYVGFRNLAMLKQMLEMNELVKQQQSQVNGISFGDESSNKYSFYGIEKTLH